MEYLKLKNRTETVKIVELFNKTFTDSEGKDEGKIISQLAEDFLRKTDENNIEIFIAVDNDRIVGSIIFSKMRFDNSSINTFLLAPVAIHTDYQGKGIGKQLINFGHTELKKLGVQLVITYGDINFYSRVGYKLTTEDVIPAPLKLTYPEGWLAQSLTEDEIVPIKGSSFCVDEINRPELW